MATEAQDPRTLERGVDAPTMVGAFQSTAARFPDVVAIRTVGDGESVTWAEYADKVRKVAAGLAKLGVRRGDRVGLMMTNRPEFHWCDTGAMHLGATCFSVYNTSAPEQLEYLLGDAGNDVLFIEKAFADRVPDGLVEHLIVIDDGGLDELMASGDEDFDFDAAWQAVERDDVLCLIYTSGTTGPPKGVQLTHHNLMTETRSFEVIVPPSDGEGRVASYLPMAHIAERGFSHYHAIPRGWTVTCIPDPAQMVPSLADIRPTAFVGVPRVWEKMKAALEAKLPAPPSALPDEAKKGVLGMLGFDALEKAYVGAAPVPVEVLEFFDDLGITITEVWGMSETSAVATANIEGGRAKFGTVGVPVPDVEVTLAEDGEVLVRGDIVMLGYRNQPDKTAETIDSDGWLHTGDIGQFDDDGYLKIVDRKKELIINAAGKNMSPANIEARIKAASPVIGQAVAIGDAKPYNVALIVPEPEFADQADEATIQAAIDKANSQLSRVEQIKKFAILRDEWLPGGDELTPTMKLKRKPIAEKYAQEIAGLYEG